MPKKILLTLTPINVYDIRYTAKNEPEWTTWWKQHWTIFCCQHSSPPTILNNIAEPESGVTILFNTVNSLRQCWQQNIVQYIWFSSTWNELFIFCCVFGEISFIWTFNLCIRITLYSHNFGSGHATFEVLHYTHSIGTKGGLGEAQSPMSGSARPPIGEIFTLIGENWRKFDGI